MAEPEAPHLARARQAQELAEKASPGEWRRMVCGGISWVLCPMHKYHPDIGYGHGNGHSIAVPSYRTSDQRNETGYYVEVVDDRAAAFGHDDAAFIAAMRTLGPQLAADVVELSAKLSAADKIARVAIEASGNSADRMLAAEDNARELKAQHETDQREIERLQTVRPTREQLIELLLHKIPPTAAGISGDGGSSCIQSFRYTDAADAILALFDAPKDGTE